MGQTATGCKNKILFYTRTHTQLQTLIQASQTSCRKVCTGYPRRSCRKVHTGYPRWSCRRSTPGTPGGAAERSTSGTPGGAAEGPRQVPHPRRSCRKVHTPETPGGAAERSTPGTPGGGLCIPVSLSCRSEQGWSTPYKGIPVYTSPAGTSRMRTHPPTHRNAPRTSQGP